MTLVGSIARSIGSLRALQGKPDGELLWASGEGLIAAASITKTAADALTAKIDAEDSLGSLERFCDIEHLQSLLNNFASGKLNKRETIALRELDKARKRRVAGEPDVVQDAFDDQDEETVE